MANNQKKIVSMRISESDHMKIKRIAKRLETRDADVIRFAIKTMLSKLSPLDRYDRSGSQLLPAFLEMGNELASYFDLDAYKLNVIINQSVDATIHEVDARDIELIAMSGLPDHFLQAKINDLLEIPTYGNVENALREYLYEKYLRTNEVITE